VTNVGPENLFPGIKYYATKIEKRGKKKVPENI